MSQYHFDPETYEALMAREVPAYDRLHDQLAAAARRPGVTRILDLGTGTGVTARRVLAIHPQALLVGVDQSARMLAVARRTLAGRADLRTARLQEPLPPGPFDLVVSALAIHHLDGAGKADLFRRIAEILGPGGRFVLGDLIVPDDPNDMVTPIDRVYDQPSTLAEQQTWLRAARLSPSTMWVERDLAVLVADRHE